MKNQNSLYYVDPRLTGRQKSNEHSIIELMESTKTSRDEVLNKLYLVQPPIIRSKEPFRSSKESIKQIKRITTIKDDSLVIAFSKWANFKPNWGSFIFNGVQI